MMYLYIYLSISAISVAILVIDYWYAGCDLYLGDLVEMTLLTTLWPITLLIMLAGWISNIKFKRIAGKFKRVIVLSGR